MSQKIKNFDYSLCCEQLRACDLHPLADVIDAMLIDGFDETRYGDLSRWQQAVDALPPLLVSAVDLCSDSVTVVGEKSVDSAVIPQLETQLRALMPWRKGPFSLFDIPIDTEWRSDFKWKRLVNDIAPLRGRTVLDVGCGSGYHCWRMAGEEAKLVIGIDPTPLFVCQYWAMQRYIQDPRVWVLPTRMENLPSKLQGFDTVFSMGVLYHRRSPIDHLQELKDALVDGGELLLETLVIEGEVDSVLVPSDRYSKMGNVWFIPSVAALCGWMRKLKFRDVTVIDVSVTTSREQRATSWMTYQSLADFLDPLDSRKTIEGYPAPMRALVRARV